LIHLLKDAALESVLVFSRTKHGADKIARRLTQSGVSTATLHSNRSQNQRLAALRDFKSGKVRVLVATDIAARGIDVEGISHVVNFDFPPQPEDYVHRIGRTGRAKAIGDAISFVTPDDHANLRALERFISRGIPRKTAPAFDMRESAEDAAVARQFEDRPRHDHQRGERHFGASPRRESRSETHTNRSGPRATSRPKAGASQRRHPERSTGHTPFSRSTGTPSSRPSSERPRYAGRKRP
ncbi:MAG TPA: C-terminal helicase domain-containing protein, partial [Thermoanaerobaculia bacterium]|nr:C-terminal helicase domain-containing protein [Thermoanaerobaculia bacterium]